MTPPSSLAALAREWEAVAQRYSATDWDDLPWEDGYKAALLSCAIELQSELKRLEPVAWRVDYGPLGQSMDEYFDNEPEADSYAGYKSEFTPVKIIPLYDLRGSTRDE